MSIDNRSEKRMDIWNYWLCGIYRNFFEFC